MNWKMILAAIGFEIFVILAVLGAGLVLYSARTTNDASPHPLPPMSIPNR